MVFEEQGEMKKGQGLWDWVGMILCKKRIKEGGGVGMGGWYNKVEEGGMDCFNVIGGSLYEEYDEIVNLQKDGC